MSDPLGDAWRAQVLALGEVIRAQRQLAKLSLRDLAALTDVSNAYLSQVERGMHEPSVRVLRAIGEALELPADALLREAGLLDDDAEPTDAVSLPALVQVDGEGLGLVLGQWRGAGWVLDGMLLMQRPCVGHRSLLGDLVWLPEP